MHFESARVDSRVFDFWPPDGIVSCRGPVIAIIIPFLEGDGLGRSGIAIALRQDEQPIVIYPV